MFISKKRHRREIEQAKLAQQRLNDEAMACTADGICLVDESDQIVAPVSRGFSTIFGKRDSVQGSFAKLLGTVLPAETVTSAIEHMKVLRTTENVAEIKAANPLAKIRVRLLTADGTFAQRYLRFEFRRSSTHATPRTLIVVVSDITAETQFAAELTELRDYSATQSLCLMASVRLGAERFLAFLQRTDVAMNAINGVLKKPARESGAFQSKLQDILAEVRRVANDAGSLQLGSIELQAREFERSIDELCAREGLSGTDFLPLAVELDQLFAQLALMRSLVTVSRSVAEPANLPEAEAPPTEPATENRVGQMTENGTQIIAAPRFDLEQPEEPAAPPVVMRTASAGSLESALLSLTDHVAQTTQRSVALHCGGLDAIPPRYQSIVKNIAIQLIRNAVKHGIEPANERVACGKLAFGKLSLEFRRLDDGSFDFYFEDDGRGLDAAGMRESAVAQGLISAEDAQRLPDRQAIKLLFKSGIAAEGAAVAPGQRGVGMTLVRRLVAEANGRIALSTIPGQQTRFKVSLPAVMEQTQVA